ncbi:hypothetical protein RCL_jg22531.t1 [Rhizophagus clarus]|uniref:Uncharacterized protein n=1 Tax=Rhizophagus clarus TaxID=94130 RepID=A0A8H3MF38_9GLOM|nr:hypothetical protein RCL_jg22531.t1 [Rhizophagus clarus]
MEELITAFCNVKCYDFIHNLYTPTTTHNEAIECHDEVLLYLQHQKTLSFHPSRTACSINFKIGYFRDSNRQKVDYANFILKLEVKETSDYKFTMQFFHKLIKSNLFKQNVNFIFLNETNMYINEENMFQRNVTVVIARNNFSPSIAVAYKNLMNEYYISISEIKNIMDFTELDNC